MRLVLGMAKRISLGTCHLIMPDGRLATFVGKTPGLEAICVIHNERVALKLLLRGTVGFCESYLEGDWSSPDVTALFELAQRNEQTLIGMIDGPAWTRRIQGILNWRRRNSKRGSRRNISAHYDLGNSFYKSWLDEGMTYSSGIFPAEDKGNDALLAAQNEKYARLIEMLDLRQDHHLLEIGCGWGGFAEYAAAHAGCRVTGVTISQAQHDYALQRIEKAGLGGKVDIKLCDYRDIEGRFDRIASIEMFEAVGEAYWHKFFDIVRNRLQPGGIAAMQVITIAERHFNAYRKGADYIQKYIFPGGMLPTLTHLREEVEKASLQWREAHAFGEHYARTLAEWRRRFLANWPDIKLQGFDERFRRMWEQYFCYCEAGFRAGSIDVRQFSFSTAPD